MPLVISPSFIILAVFKMYILYPIYSIPRLEFLFTNNVNIRNGLEYFRVTVCILPVS